MTSSSFKLEKEFVFYTEDGTVAVDSDGEAIAIGVSRASPRGAEKGKEGGHAYVVWRRNKVVFSWRFDAEKGFNCAAFKPSSDLVVFGNDDGFLYVFNKSGELLKTVNVDSPIYSCAFSPSGSYLAMGTEGGKVTVRDSNFDPLWEYLTEDNVWGLSWSPDERFVAVASHDGNLYVLTKPKEVWKDDLKSPVNRVVWCDDYLVAGTWEPGTVALYDASDPTSPTKLWERELLGNVWGLDMDSACNYVLAGSSNSIVKIFSIDGKDVMSMEAFPVDDVAWAGATVAIGGKSKVEVYAAEVCLPYAIPSLRRFKIISLSKPENLNVVEMSEVLYLLLNKPKKIKVNGDEFEVRPIKGDFLYILSPYDGEVEVEVVDEAQ